MRKAFDIQSLKQCSVTFKFPSLSSRYGSIAFQVLDEHDEWDLKAQFQHILGSLSSATLACPGSSARVLAMAVMLDFLRATLESWRPFVGGVFISLETRSGVEDVESRLRNGSQLRWLAKLPRNLQLAFHYTYNSMLPHVMAVDASQKAKLEAIQMEFDYKIEWITNRMDGLVQDLEVDLMSKSARSEQAQTESVKRLTILAAIFLPLSLSSSLLSMSSKITELGVLWYDYFAISVSMALLMVVAYAGMRGWQADASQRHHRLPLPTDSFVMRVNKHFHLFLGYLYDILLGHIYEQGLLTLLSYFFGLAVVASFWVGVVQEMSLGLKILGYATAGFAACLIIVWLSRLFFPALCRR
jgi:hypothetical protein